MENSLSKSSELYEKARRMINEGKFEDAIELFQQSISYNPHFKTLELLGECFTFSDRLVESIVPLAAAVGLNKGVRAASLLAEVFLKLEGFPAAKNMSEVALSRDSNNLKAQKVNKLVNEIIREEKSIRFVCFLG